MNTGRRKDKPLSFIGPSYGARSMKYQISVYFGNRSIVGDQYDEGNKILDSLEKKFCSDTPKSKGDLLNELRTAEKKLKKHITVDGFNPDFHELKDALRAPPASA